MRTLKTLLQAVSVALKARKGQLPAVVYNIYQCSHGWRREYAYGSQGSKVLVCRLRQCPSNFVTFPSNVKLVEK